MSAVGATLYRVRAYAAAVDFLRRPSQLRDLDFILAHIDDLREVFEVRDGEVKVIQVQPRRTAGSRCAGVPGQIGKACTSSYFPT